MNIIEIYIPLCLYLYFNIVSDTPYPVSIYIPLCLYLYCDYGIIRKMSDSFTFHYVYIYMCHHLY